MGNDLNKQNVFSIIEHNRTVHDVIASEYDNNHIEIYNPTEQRRIKSTIIKVVDKVKTNSNVIRVLDYGAGTGNVTKHLIELDAKVIASDISIRSLEQLKLKLGSSHKLETAILNGIDLSDFGDNTFDMVVTYSVLHHVPDYLKIVGEFARITKPGGIIYIDHEVCSSYWEESINYQSYLAELGKDFAQSHLFELEIQAKANPLIKMIKKIIKTIFLQPLRKLTHTKDLSSKEDITNEGDIHTYKSDHIEWDKIKLVLNKYSEIIFEEDYLVCRELNENAPIWNKWKNKCFDMHLIIVRKNY